MPSIIDEKSPVPKYCQLRDYLRQEISSGRLKPGDMIPTEAKLTKRCRVNRLTVRQAIMGLVNEGKLHRHRGVGTFVAEPRLNHSIGIGLYDIDYLSRPFFSQLAVGIGKVANDLGYHFHILSTNTELDSPQACTRVVEKGGIDGVIICDQLLDDAVITRLWKKGLPMVLARRCPPDPAIPSVQVDEKGGVFTAVSHLIKLGHRRIALQIARMTFTIDREKMEGYRQALAEHGLAYDPDLVFEYGKGPYEKAKSYLKGDNPPTAIMASDDIYATEAIRAANDLGLRVPGDIAVVGIGDDLLHPFQKPALTTMRLLIEDIGKQAADMLFQQVRGESLEQTKVVFEPQLIVRESCGARQRAAVVAS